ncbi:MAG: carboxymuconolactone decarboxylase family protein [Chloroflexi bacterium]|nr:carboxymuconolactone decarboxylase family protein [Chloroflexota bacterium]MDA1003820.1 carboxymuconolactone decarboxylase family protein [Chloroflexota bacterium]
MSRLPNMTDRTSVPEASREAFDAVAGNRGGAVSGPYGVLLHSPELAIRGSALSNYVRRESDLTPVQREIAILTTARRFDAAVMWAGHVHLGRDAGVREEVIDAIAYGRDPSTLTDAEAEIVRYVRELFEHNRVTDTTYAALHTRLGDRGIVDLTGLVGYYAFVGTTLNAFEIEAPKGAPRLP